VSAPRRVEVAVDAAGVPGGRTYTYDVPSNLADIVVGEAVIVPYGGRQALGVVMAEAESAPAVATKPIAARVRADGPLLPPMTVALARWISEHYVAPPGLVVRAMLPPGTLERLELLARRTAAPASDGLEPELIAVLRRLEAAPSGVPVRALRTDEGRAALLRRLRAAESKGLVELGWTLLPPSVRARLERHARLSAEGRAAIGDGAVVRLGPRQRALLEELVSAAPEPLHAARLAERHGGSAVSSLARRGLLELEVVEVARRAMAERPERSAPVRPSGAALTGAQHAAVVPIVSAIRDRRHESFLLDGVSAAGKTAVFAEAIRAALAEGRDAIVLVPEVALAAPLLDRLRTELGESPALLHASLSDGERADEWQRVRSGAARVVVGTRLAVLAPVARPGLVIVDEEHDGAYKSDRTPRYSARDVALELARLAACPAVLASATPDVVSAGRAERSELTHLPLPERAAGTAPRVDLVDLRAELAAGNRGLVSEPLSAALRALDVSEGDRAILVLNRRGTASVVLCRDCGYVQICPECRRPLVYHAGRRALRCHHCGATAAPASRCPACSSPRIRYLGGGTERLEREVREGFPALRVARLDRDVVERKGAAEGVIDAFTDGAIDVLVGTTLVTKGFDVAHVTLVGIVSADVALNLPDERAAERTYQLLRQAIGRAGRGERPGRAIVQTYQPEHPAIVAAVSGDAETFYRAELEVRRAFGSPPFGRLVKLTAATEDRDEAERIARALAEELRERARASGDATSVIGPAPAYVERRGGRWRFNVILRGPDPLALLGGDPGQPWSIDVDPDSLL
jgi:primosomal protein N' (replication factor Y)